MFLQQTTYFARLSKTKKKAFGPNHSHRVHTDKCSAVIDGKAGKAATLHKFSDMLTLSLPRGGRLWPLIGFALPKFLP
jgi:hypothetical protein